MDVGLTTRPKDSSIYEQIREDRDRNRTFNSCKSNETDAN